MKAFLKLLPLVMIGALSIPSASAQGDSQSPYMSGVRYDLPAVLITAADIARTRKEMEEKKEDDIGIRMIDCGGGEGGHNVGLSLVSRAKGQSTAGAVHDQISEVYHVLEGSGTMVLGGKLTSPKRRPVSPLNGPGISGASIEGGVKTRISKGDVLVIPAGTPHRFESTDAFTLYTVTRVDPQKVTRLQ